MVRFSLVVAMLLLVVVQESSAQDEPQKIAEKSQAIIFAHRETTVEELKRIVRFLEPRVSELLVKALHDGEVSAKIFANVEEAELEDFIADLKKLGVDQVELNPYELEWIEFSEEKLEELRESKNVAIFFRADWCLTCAMIDKETFTHSEVLLRIRELDLHLMRADLTARDSSASEFAKFHGVTTVPTLLCYPRHSPEETVTPDEVDLISSRKTTKVLEGIFKAKNDSEEQNDEGADQPADAQIIR